MIDFFDFYGEGEKLKNENLLNAKTFQINLKRNDDQSGSILFFSNFHEYAAYCTGSWSSSQTVVFYVQKQCWLTARQAATNLHNLKSSHNTTNVFTYNRKSSLNFSSTHVCICVKDATPLLQIWRSRFGVLLLCCFYYCKTNFASLCPWPSPIKVYKEALVITSCDPVFSLIRWDQF